MPCYDPKSILIFILAIILIIFIIFFIELGHRDTLPNPNICQSSFVLPPANFTSTSINNGTQVTWSGSSTDISYNLYKGSSINFDISGMTPTNIPTSEYFVPITTNDIYIKVSAVDKNGCTSPTVPPQGYRVVSNLNNTSNLVLADSNGNFINVSADGTLSTLDINSNFQSYTNPINKWTFDNGQLVNPTLNKCLNSNIQLGSCNNTDKWTISNTSGHICLQSDNNVCLSSNGLLLQPFDLRNNSQRFRVDTMFPSGSFSIRDKITGKYMIYTGQGPVYAYSEKQLNNLAIYVDNWIMDGNGLIHPVLNNCNSVDLCLGVIDDCVGVESMSAFKSSNRVWMMVNDTFLCLASNKNKCISISPRLANVMVSSSASALDFDK